MSHFVRLSVRLLGLLLMAMGLFLAWDGTRLALLGGSFYYVIFGALILISGILLLLLQEAGAWLYLLGWAGTFFWTVWECGTDWWGWLPRFFGPTLIAFWVIFILPGLRRYAAGGKDR